MEDEMTHQEAEACASEIDALKGNHLFAFRAEGYPADFRCVIGAKSVSYKQLR
jgi:hypothetical protein